MKKILFLLLLSFAASAQVTIKQYNIVIAGNSLSANAGTHPTTYSYPQVLSRQLGANYKITNSGVGGQTTQDISSSYTSQIGNYYDASTYAANILVIWEGRNDMILNSLTTTQTYNNLVTLCGTARAQGWKIIVVDITPSWSSSYKGDATVTGYNQLDADRITVSNSIIANWATFADGLVRLSDNSLIGSLSQSYQSGYTFSSVTRPTVSTNLMYDDGTHFAQLGYQLIAEKVRQAILKLA